ncbi:helix-turn-helix transcriptional regulator [Neobacillus vireti]|uniref:helix-turn-helix transcriptional regulator n=1 Tax=Neobacillus vireti TaxID=220686 RepID=UPI003B585F75
MYYQIGRCLLSDRLREVGMSQSQLAERLNVSRQQVNKWATDRQGMSLETAKNICKVLDLDRIDDLFEWVPTRRSRK